MKCKIAYDLPNDRKSKFSLILEEGTNNKRQSNRYYEPLGLSLPSVFSANPQISNLVPYLFQDPLMRRIEGSPMIPPSALLHNEIPMRRKNRLIGKVLIQKLLDSFSKYFKKGNTFQIPPHHVLGCVSTTKNVKKRDAKNRPRFA